MTEIWNLIGAVLICFGAFFGLASAIGLVRFPDLLTRMHAATKIQVFGLVLTYLGVAVTLRDWFVTATMALVIGFQVLTTPVSGHLVSRTVYRLNYWRCNDVVIDELADDLAQSGFTKACDPDPVGPPG